MLGVVLEVPRGDGVQMIRPDCGSFEGCQDELDGVRLSAGCDPFGGLIGIPRGLSSRDRDLSSSSSSSWVKLVQTHLTHLNPS